MGKADMRGRSPYPGHLTAREPAGREVKCNYPPKTAEPFGERASGPQTTVFFFSMIGKLS